MSPPMFPCAILSRRHPLQIPPTAIQGFPPKAPIGRVACSADEGKVQERKQKLLSRNLESVFCLSISKLQGEARKLDSAWRYLDLEICPGSKIRGEARNLESGWPAPVLGNCSSTPKIRAAPALSLPVQCVRLPRCFRTDTCTFLFSCVLETRNHGKWKLRSLYRYCMYARFPHTRKAVATLHGPRRAQRLGQSARRCSARRGRLGIASEHARILAAPAVARRIESRAALHRRRHLLSCDGRISGHAAPPLPHDWICAAPAKPAGTGAPSAVAGAVGALTGCLTRATT